MNLFSLNLPPDKAENAEQAVLTALTNAVDLSSPPLNICATVVKGFDAAILDALFTSPTPDMCPFVGINTWVSRGRDAVGGQEVYRDFNMSFYIINYYGNPATDPSYWASPIKFESMQDRHIAACMKAVELQVGGNPTATIPVRGWLWNAAIDATYDYFSPFRYITQSYKLPDGYNCVRVDRPMKVYY